jgi:hypothetical protein
MSEQQKRQSPFKGVRFEGSFVYSVEQLKNIADDCKMIVENELEVTSIRVGKKPMDYEEPWYHREGSREQYLPMTHEDVVRKHTK